jgi:hypothetical protein
VRTLGVSPAMRIDFPPPEEPIDESPHIRHPPSMTLGAG